MPICAFAAVPVVCLIGFCVAGVHIRYVYDVLPSLCLLGSMAFMRRVGNSIDRGDTLPLRLLVLAAFLTCLMAFSLTFYSERCFIAQYRPDVYVSVVRSLSL